MTRRSYHSAKVLDACAGASNCETYESPTGLKIRFVPGTEPGTEAYGAQFAHSKRDGNATDAKTYVTYGDTSINYGTAGASGTGGIFHHLYDRCHESACDTTAASYSGSAVLGGQLTDINMIIHPHGNFAGYGERQVFIEAIVAAASQGEQCTDEKYYLNSNPLTGQYTSPGSQHQCTQTNFISVNRFQGGSLQGWIDVEVEQEVQESGWCQVLGDLSAVASIVGAVPGAGEVAGVAGGFFGVIQAGCGQ